jgi:hypothetical protein
MPSILPFRESFRSDGSHYHRLAVVSIPGEVLIFDAGSTHLDEDWGRCRAVQTTGPRNARTDAPPHTAPPQSHDGRSITPCLAWDTNSDSEAAYGLSIRCRTGSSPSSNRPGTLSIRRKRTLRTVYVLGIIGSAETLPARVTTLTVGTSGLISRQAPHRGLA